MATMTKLTPALLKRIILEEKKRIKKQLQEYKNIEDNKNSLRIKKLSEEQVKLIKKYKLLQEVKKLLKNKLNGSL
jgi:hypothetical protein